MRAKSVVGCALLLALVGMLVGCAGARNDLATEATSTRPEDDSQVLLPVHTYVLEDVHEVDGRQGVAAEGERVWVSGSTTLSCYDSDWNLIATNESPFDSGYEHEVNHIGDIDVWQGELYAGVEKFLDGEASNIQIAVYDAATLELKRTFGFEPTSGQDECSGICVDAQSGSVWLCSWTSTGRYLYRYNLGSGEYLGRVQLHASPQWIQGVACHEGSLYVTADDGDADQDEPDHVYRIAVPEGATHAAVALERTLDDVTRQGEVEGLTFTDDGHMMVLYNRGARIVAGMPTGFYDGYDHEVHEVFVYDMDKR